MGRTGKQSNWRDQSCACHVVPIQSLKDFPGSIVDSTIGLFELSQLSRLKFAKLIVMVSDRLPQCTMQHSRPYVYAYTIRVINTQLLVALRKRTTSDLRASISLITVVVWFSCPFSKIQLLVD